MCTLELNQIVCISTKHFFFPNKNTFPLCVFLAIVCALNVQVYFSVYVKVYLFSLWKKISLMCITLWQNRSSPRKIPKIIIKKKSKKIRKQGEKIDTLLAGSPTSADTDVGKSSVDITL